MTIRRGSSIIAGCASSSVNPDNKSITTNQSDQLQTVGVINQNDTSVALKQWSGTLAQYNAIIAKDSNTIYNIIDDTQASNYQAYTKGETNTLLAEKPDDDTVVHLTGDETINGAKTFTENLKVTRDWACIYLDQENIERGVYPETGEKNAFLFFRDKNENNLGSIKFTQDNAGVSSIKMVCNYPDGSSGSPNIGVFYDSINNKAYGWCPAPDTSDNSSKIATTSFVKAQGYLTAHQSLTNYVTTNTAQTISAAKTFSANPTIARSGPACILKNTNITKGTAPTAAVNTEMVRLYDSAGKNMALLRFRLETNNTGTTYIITSKNSAASDTALYSVGVRATSAGAADFIPASDNSYGLGGSSLRWKQLYAGTTTISTSDERTKQQITEIPENVLEVWSKVNFCQFKFNDAVEEKGNNARYHTGMIAQRIKEVFEDADIDPFSYGLLCYDEWEATEPSYDEDGNVEIPGVEAGNRYSLRYEECLCMEAAYQRYRADKLEARLAALEAKLQ